MADNITVSDANDVDRILRTTDTASVHTPHHIVDSSALPTGAATEATLATINGKVTACDTGAVTIASSALPSGAATSTLQTSGNASLTTLAGAVSGTEMQVDVVTSALPTGAATAASQATGNTSLGTIAGAVSGSEMQVDVVGSLPAGTNAIGKLAANSGVDIGDVDVTSVAIPSAIFSGKKTVSSAGTAEAIASSQAILSGVTVKALAGNSGIVYIGPSSVDSTNGLELSAKESVFLEVANLATVYVDAASSSDGITYLAS